MDKLYYTAYHELAYIILCLMIAGSLFFMMSGIRALRNQLQEGWLYLTISLFFTAVHFFYLYNLPPDNSISLLAMRLDTFQWLTLFFAPALILLYLVVGIVSMVVAKFRNGLIRLFFGLTLLCYIYMLGTSWPMDIKGIITILFTLSYLEIEYRSAVN